MKKLLQQRYDNRKTRTIERGYKERKLLTHFRKVQIHGEKLH